MKNFLIGDLVDKSFSEVDFWVVEGSIRSEHKKGLPVMIVISTAAMSVLCPLLAAFLESLSMRLLEYPEPHDGPQGVGDFILWQLLYGQMPMQTQRLLLSLTVQAIIVFVVLISLIQTLPRVRRVVFLAWLSIWVLFDMSGFWSYKIFAP